MTVLLALMACASRFPTPYTASELAAAERRIPGAVVHYLGQADADVRVCELNRKGPTIPAADPEVLSALRRAALRGQIPAETAGGCWGALLSSHPDRDTVAAQLLDLAVHQVRSDPAHPVLEALVHAFLERPTDTTIDPGHAEEVVASLQGSTHPLATALLDDIELAAGRLRGQRVDASMLASLKEEDLARLARRLPDFEMRDRAAAQLVSVRVDASVWSAVREDAPRLRELVVDQGFNPVPDDSVVISARWEPDALGTRVIRIQAEPMTSSARLVGARSEDRALTSEPVLDLSGLRVSVKGYPEAPLEVCDEDAFFDPSPCVPGSMLHLEDRYARLDGTRVQLATDLTLDDVVLLGRGGDVFAPPMRVGGADVIDFAFQVHFDPVPSIRFGGGRDLTIDLYEISAGRVIVGVKRSGSDEIAASAVVPLTDAAFRVVSIGTQGANGSSGSNGSNGMAGYSGSPGSCYSPGGRGGNGTSGSPGGRGGNGQPGGSGGDILVTLHCDDCDSLRTFGERQIRSIGGQGGQGGPGGRGGQGGAGGSGGSGGSCSERDPVTGNTTYKTTPSGSSGSSGSKGSDGSSGSPGAQGSPGDVIFRVAE